MAEVLFRAKLTREGSSTPWGFRLQGGVEYDKPLTLLKVVEDSLAAKGGLHPGDIVVKLAGRSAEDMTHKDAQEAIISAGDALEIIVERAEVTMTTIATPTSPPTAGCDVKPSGSAQTTEPTFSNTGVKVTESRTSPSPAEQIDEEAISKSPERDQRIESIPDKDKDRTTAVDTGSEPPPAQDRSPDTASAAPSDGGAETRAKLSKALENDKIGKEAAASVIHIKASDTSNGELKTSLAHDVPSKCSHPLVQPPDTSHANHTENDAVDTLDSSRLEGNIAADDSNVMTQVCDNSQETKDSKLETKIVECDEKKDSRSEATTVASLPSRSLTTVSYVESSPTSTSKPSSITSVSDRAAVNEQCQVDGDKMGHAVQSVPSSDRREPETADVSNSVLPRDSVTETTDLSAPNKLCTPSVINQFQSSAISSKPQPEAGSDKPASASSPGNEETLPQPSPLSASQITETPSQVPHIPHSSVTAVTATVATTPTPDTVPISLVVTEVPSVTVEATIIDISQPSHKAQKVAPSAPVVTTISIAQDTAHVTESVSIKAAPSQTEIAPMPVTVSVPIRVQHAGEATSRQTKAPLEEIIIASKPSLQIVTTSDHRETIRIPAGDKRKDEPSGERQEEATVTSVSHEKKDFSKTAPWRVHKSTPSATTTSASVPTSAPRSIEKNVLHPWRKSRAEHVMSHSLDDRQLSAAANRLTENVEQSRSTEKVKLTPIPAISQIEISQKKPQSTLTYVGKRIESPPVGSPVSAPTAAPSFQKTASASTAPLPAGRVAPPSERSNTTTPHTTPPSTSDPISMPKPSPVSEQQQEQQQQQQQQQQPAQPEEIHLQVAAPDLVDIPMPAVKEMVENLNKRLEAIAVQHPKIVEPAAGGQELGLNYFKRSGADLVSNDYDRIYGQPGGEREIIIDTPPNPNFTGASPDDLKQRRLLAPATGYYRVYDLLEAGAGGGSPGSHRRRFSLPGGSVSQRQQHHQRRVRFAEPPESSVIEIEPRRQRLLERRRLWDDDGSMSDMEDYSSASLLAAKLDRIERENALSTASFQRHRNAKQRAQSVSGDVGQTRPVESFREKVISFESLGGEPRQDDVLLSSLKPTARDKFVLGGSGGSGSRAFSLSIGPNKPGSISLSLTHQRGSGQPLSQVALSIPSSEGHFSYTISPRTGSAEPVSIRYSVPAHLATEPIVKTVHGGGDHVKAASLDGARTVHIQYPPQEGVPTLQTQLLNQTSSAHPLSPSQQVMRQLAGRPGIRSPTNYSNTLQIDTSSRLQHRSPSPPNPSYPPNILSDRSHLSPQRLIHPQVIHPDTAAAADYQTQRSSSPSQGAPIGIKVRQPSPTNPMAYQRSASPQGVGHYGLSQGGQQTPRSSGVQSTGPHGGMTHQPASPREVSPAGYQQPPRLQTGSSACYQRSVSPQGNISLVVPQSTPYQPQQTPTLSPQPRFLHPQQQQQQQQQPQQPPTPTLHPPGYSMQHPQFPQPSPRLSPRASPSHAGLSPLQVHPTPGGTQMTGLPPAGVIIGGQPSPVAGVPSSPYHVITEPAMSGPRPPGLFALFDKRFTEKFLQWNEERPGDLCRSETYKLVHEMDEKSDDL